MGLLTFGLNATLDGCIDHTQGIVDDELHDYWTQLMDQSGAMLFGRNTYELMEEARPAVARDEKAPRAMREWAQKLEAKAKYVVSGSRSDFPWQNTIKVEGDLREAISALKAKTERGVLVGAPKLAAALEELGSSTSTASSFIPSSVAAGRRCFMACRVRGISSSYRRSGSSPACMRSTSVAKRGERGRTRASHVFRRP
jgi:dihydrofolate reductase